MIGVGLHRCKGFRNNGRVMNVKGDSFDPQTRISQIITARQINYFIESYLDKLYTVFNQPSYLVIRLRGG
jgi:hypothetical protein